jgi:hypothetical protein
MFFERRGRQDLVGGDNICTPVKYWVPDIYRFDGKIKSYLRIPNILCPYPKLEKRGL